MTVVILGSTVKFIGNPTANILTKLEYKEHLWAEGTFFQTVILHFYNRRVDGLSMGTDFLPGQKKLYSI